MVLTSRICVCLIAVLVQLLQGVQCYFDYDYLIFENFDLVKEIHEAELKTHEDLKKLRDGLRARQQVLQDFKEGIPDIQDVEEYSAHPINVMDGEYYTRSQIAQIFNLKIQILLNLVQLKTVDRRICWLYIVIVRSGRIHFKPALFHLIFFF